MSTTNPGVEEDQLVFAGDFDAPEFGEWQIELAKVLNRGRPEDKQFPPEVAFERLQTTTVDGLTIDPLYSHADAPSKLGVPGAHPFTRGTTIRSGAMHAWDVRALYEDPDVAATKKAIANDLDRGVTSIWLRVDSDAIAVGDVAAVLADVYLDMASVEVSSRENQTAAAEALLAVAEASDRDPSKMVIGLGIDPIAEAAWTGAAPDLTQLATWVERTKAFEQATAITIDSTGWHNAGAGDVHEIAWALATGAEYVRVLLAAGISADDAFKAISFRVTASSDQFSTISRLRALRRCWARVGEVFEVTESLRGARQHAVTSWRELTRDDAYVNVLRASISTFSAAVGCAEAITVLPLDSVWGLPTDSTRRIARNTQIVLQEESNLGRVNDPAGGSWYVEELTRMMAEAAWSAFQDVEAAGGIVEALAGNLISEKLAELNAERTKRLAKRAKPITGVSEFPKIDENPLSAAPRPDAQTRSGIAWRRDSEVFEGLRDRVAAASGDPKVFLACLGARRDFGGREGFASNLIHVSGLPTSSTEGGSVDQIVEAWRAESTPVVVLCSSAKVYAEQALPVAKALKEAGATWVLLAGNMKELGADQAEAESVIDGTIAMGVDAVDTLSTVLDKLGVA